MLKSLLLFTAVVLLVLASASAPARSPQESGTATAAKKMNSDASAMARGKKVYNLDCALCHGEAGDGKTDLAKDMQLTLMDWTDPKSLSGKTDQQLFDEIRKGSGKMPPEDTSRAKDQDVRDVVMYIRKFAKEGTAGPSAPAPAAAPAAAPGSTPSEAPAPAAAPSPSH